MSHSFALHTEGGRDHGDKTRWRDHRDKARWRTRLTLCDYVFLCISACKTYVCTCVCVYALAWSCHSLVVQRGGCPLLGSGGQ